MLLCDSSYVFGVVDSFVLHSFVCASKNILFMDKENFPKILQKVRVLRLLVYLLLCVLRMCNKFLLIKRK